MTTMPGNGQSRFTTSHQRWQAVLARDKQADGVFLYSVRTTGVYCRPSCAARRALRQNVQFHRTCAEAERLGFRPCRRCRPNSTGLDESQSKAIADACRLIARAESAPNLAALADAARLSSSHFHRLFKRHTGVTPRAYAAQLRAARARSALNRSDTVTRAIYDAGYNSNGRFYAETSGILGMQPKTFRAGGKGVQIRFAVGECSLGSILVAATAAGICSIALGDDPASLVTELQQRFANAELIGADAAFEKLVARLIGQIERPAASLSLPLDIQGTAFQQRVWKKLCQIPLGEMRSYQQLARSLGRPKATRAVARACAANQIAVAIPCHRVVRTDGSLSGYRWGVDRKARLLKLEKPYQK